MTAPSLIKFVQKNQRIQALHLVDRELLPAPIECNKTALLFAWLWDWGLALMVGSALITAWMEFLNQLVLPFVSPFAQDTFMGSADSLTWIVAAFTHFALGFAGLCADGSSFGMRVFKHVVSSEENSLSWQEAMLYAAGSTVSLVTAGLGIFLLDRLALTSTQTTEFYHWQFGQASAQVHTTVPSLVSGLVTVGTEEFKQAA